MVTCLDDEPFDSGRIVIFRVFSPDLSPRTKGPQLIAMLLFVRPENGGWVSAGGGAIGTLAAPGRSSVDCAWTWTHLSGWQPRNLPETAAFYCTVEDARMESIEIARVDGGVQRVRVDGRQAVVFPYRWDSQTQGWPAQHPKAIRLFDASGRRLNLSVCCTMDQAPRVATATRTA